MLKNNYSGSKCPKCEKTTFEVVQETPIDSKYNLMFIRCSSCKTVISVLESHNINSTLYKIAKKLGI